MTWQEFLTEKVLGECYHEGSSLLNAGYHCRKCDKAFSVNHTFDNRNDLMDLYQKAYEDERWEEFYDLVFDLAVEKDTRAYPSRFTSILFCLDGKDYEPRCKMVAEFYGWEEKS